MKILNYICGFHYISIGQNCLETYAKKLLIVAASGKGPESLGREGHLLFINSLLLCLIFLSMQIYRFFNSKWEEKSEGRD